MNVLFLSTHLNAGGITSYLYTLTKGLIRQGHSVHVVTSGGNMEQQFLGVGAKLLNLNIRTKSELDPRIYLALKPLARYIRDNTIDVIHAHTRITQVMGALLKKITKKPLVTTCHGFFKTRLGRKLIPCWGNQTIAISEVVVDHLIKDFKVPKDKVVLIKSGIDLDEFMPVADGRKFEQRKRYNLGKEVIIGMVARLSDVKGPDLLIKAMKSIALKVQDAKLLLVGEGKMEGDLRDLVHHLGLNDRVRFFSVVNKTNEMLALFDIFAMPSRQEGLGLSIMEAQAAGLPVIASRVGGIPSLIEDGKTGFLIEPENSEALAEGIIKMCTDKNRLKEVGIAARESIKHNYSAQKMVDQTIALYQKCCKG